MLKEEVTRMALNGWDCIYVFVDLHGTIVPGTYDRSNLSTHFYPFAKEALKRFSSDGRIRLVLWSSSFDEDLAKYVEFFKKKGIMFDYINSNPEVVSDAVGLFTAKPYFNVLFDDKAGFDPNEDWREICENFVFVKNEDKHSIKVEEN